MKKYIRAATGGLIYFLIIFVVEIVYGICFPFQPESSIIITLLSAGITAVILTALYRKDQRARGITFSSCFLPHGSAKYLTVLGLCACIAGNAALTLSGLTRLFPAYTEVNEAIASVPVWLQIVSVIFVVPLTEELVFRGIFFARLRDYTGFRKAAVITAVSFGLFHGNVIQGIYAFAIGLLLAWSYEEYRNINTCWFLHGIMNASSLILGFLASFQLVSLIISVTGFIIIMRKIKENKTDEITVNRSTML